MNENERAAYRLGVLQADMIESFRRIARAMSAGMRDRTAQHAAAATDPIAAREAASVRAYRRRIANERADGLSHVRAEARRVRRELGLPEGVA